MYPVHGNAEVLMPLGGVLLIVGLALLAAAGTFVVEWLLPAWRRQPINEVVGFVYAVVGVAYSVLLGLVVINGLTTLAPLGTHMTGTSYPSQPSCPFRCPEQARLTSGRSPSETARRVPFKAEHSPVPPRKFNRNPQLEEGHTERIRGYSW